MGSIQVSGPNAVIIDTRPAVTGFVWEGNWDIYVLGDPDLKMDGCELPESCPTRQHPVIPFLDLGLQSPVPTHQLSRVITRILVPNFAEEGSFRVQVTTKQKHKIHRLSQWFVVAISLVPAPPVYTTHPRQAQLAVRDSSRPFLAAISSHKKRFSTTISTEQVRPVPIARFDIAGAVETSQ